MAIGPPNAGTAVTNTSAATTTCPFPTVTHAGALLTLGISLNAINGSATTPAGWTVLGAQKGGAGAGTGDGGTGVNIPSVYTFYKFADGTEGGTNLSITHTNTPTEAQIVEWPGVDSQNPIDVAVTFTDQSAGGTANCVLANLTPVTPGCTVLYWAGDNTASHTATQPNGYTELCDGSGASSNLESAYQQNVTAGVAIGGTVVFSGAGKQVAVFAALRPSSQDAVQPMPQGGATWRRRNRRSVGPQLRDVGGLFDNYGYTKMTAGATSATVDISNAAVDSTVYCWLGIGNVQTSVTMTGWTQLLSADEGAATHYALFRRRKVAGDTTFTVSWSPNSTKATIGWVSYVGLDPITPDEQATATVHSSGNTFPSPTLTPVTDQEWAVYFSYERDTTAAANLPDGSTWTPDLALTERLDAANQAAGSSPWISVEIADSRGIVSRAAHSYTATGVTETHGAAVLLYLFPAGTAPTPPQVRPNPPQRVRLTSRRARPQPVLPDVTVVPPVNNWLPLGTVARWARFQKSQPTAAYAPPELSGPFNDWQPRLGKPAQWRRFQKSRPKTAYAPPTLAGPFNNWLPPVVARLVRRARVQVQPRRVAAPVPPTAVPVPAPVRRRAFFRKSDPLSAAVPPTTAAAPVNNWQPQHRSTSRVPPWRRARGKGLPPPPTLSGPFNDWLAAVQARVTRRKFLRKSDPNTASPPTPTNLWIQPNQVRRVRRFPVRKSSPGKAEVTPPPFFIPTNNWQPLHRTIARAAKATPRRGKTGQPPPTLAGPFNYWLPPVVARFVRRPVTVKPAARPKVGPVPPTVVPVAGPQPKVRRVFRRRGAAASPPVTIAVPVNNWAPQHRSTARAAKATPRRGKHAAPVPSTNFWIPPIRTRVARLPRLPIPRRKAAGAAPPPTLVPIPLPPNRRRHGQPTRRTRVQKWVFAVLGIDRAATSVDTATAQMNSAPTATGPGQTSTIGGPTSTDSATGQHWSDSTVTD